MRGSKWVIRAGLALLSIVLAFSYVSPGQSAGGLKDTGPDFERQFEETILKNPEDLTFVLRLTGGKKQYYPGQVIPIELEFSSSRPDTYQVNTATYDRSGRLGIDGFHLSNRVGVEDPMREYFSLLTGFIGGGIHGTPVLQQKLVTIHLELNEWFRFDQPGHFRLYLTTARVTRRCTAKTGSCPAPVASNIVEFDILPEDEAWASGEAKRAVHKIENDVADIERRKGCRILRFLGTRQAVREMIRRYSYGAWGCEFEYMAGLMGARDREYVVQEMDRSLVSPGYAVTGSFLRTISRLAALLKSGAEADITETRRVVEQEMTRNLTRLAEVLPQKTGQARARAFHALLLSVDNQRAGKNPALSSVMESLGEEMAAVFPLLPVQSQETLLSWNDHWKRFGSFAMIPALRRVFEEAPDERIRLRERALIRLYELNPSEGRELILKEIRSLKPRVGVRALGLLPESELPEMDGVFLQMLSKNNIGQLYVPLVSPAYLIERYGTPAIFADVKSFYETELAGRTCPLAPPFLAYFLRVNTAYGETALRNFLKTWEPGRPQCYQEFFRRTMPLHCSSELEQIAIESLRHKDPRVVLDAAKALSLHGSPEAERPLWDALRNWRKRWQGRENQLHYRTFGSLRSEADIVHSWNVGLDTNLATALAEGRAWLSDREKLQKIKELCITENCHYQLSHKINRWGARVPISPSFAQDGKWGLSVAQYERMTMEQAKEKLGQFPPGTIFSWKPYNCGKVVHTVDEMFPVVAGFIEGFGMRVQRICEIPSVVVPPKVN